MTVTMTTRLRSFAFASALLLTAAPAQAQEVMLRGTLGGGNVMSATESPATGEVAAVLTQDGVLQLDMIFTGLELGATGAALHTGKYNENGPMVARLDIEAGASSSRITGAQIALTPLAAAAVSVGDSYVVVSTIEHPDGAIRAQLMPQPVRLDGMPRAIPPAAVEPVVAPPRYTPTPVDEPEEEEEEEDE